MRIVRDYKQLDLFDQKWNRMTAGQRQLWTSIKESADHVRTLPKWAVELQEAMDKQYRGY